MQQLTNDVERWNLKNRPLLSVFFGGGTPSLMSTDFFKEILSAIDKNFVLQPDIEITVETNPEAVTKCHFQEWRALGINRISFGVQSFQKHLLQKLGRRHSPQQASDAVQTAEAAGFDNISLDLIFGVEGESGEDLQKDLQMAMERQVPHISAYQLTVEAGTPLASWVNEGRFLLPEEEEVAAMHKIVSETLEQNGWHRYEISNYALPGFESRHNLQYWRYRDFLGIGSGAVSFIHGKRWRTTRKLKNYLNRHALYEEEETIDKKTARKERWMMGLRLAEGVALNSQELQLWKQDLLQWAKDGWISIHKDKVTLTPKGFLFCSQVVKNVFDLVDKMC